MPKRMSKKKEPIDIFANDRLNQAMADAVAPAEELQERRCGLLDGRGLLLGRHATGAQIEPVAMSAAP